MTYEQIEHKLNRLLAKFEQLDYTVQNGHYLASVTNLSLPGMMSGSNSAARLTI